MCETQIYIAIWTFERLLYSVVMYTRRQARSQGNLLITQLTRSKQVLNFALKSSFFESPKNSFCDNPTM